MTDGMVLVVAAGSESATVAAKAERRKAQPRSQSQPARRPRSAGQWTSAKRDLFLTRLAETGNVTEALAETGMSHAGLYKLRSRSAAFCASWDAALDLGYVRVEAMLLDRALNGRRRVFREGVIVEEFIECTDSLALSLLAHHRKRVSEYRVAVSVNHDNPERLRERFMVKLQRLARAAGWQG